MSQIKTILLPSMLRRTMTTYALKPLIRSTGAELHRIGRSRNWQLNASLSQISTIIELIEQQDEASWQWIAKRLRELQQQYSYQELMALARLKPGITVNELMARSDCTIAVARKIIDELEWQDEQPSK